MAPPSMLETSLSVPQSLAKAALTPGSSRTSHTWEEPRVSEGIDRRRASLSAETGFLSSYRFCSPSRGRAIQRNATNPLLLLKAIGRVHTSTIVHGEVLLTEGSRIVPLESSTEAFQPVKGGGSELKCSLPWDGALDHDVSIASKIVSPVAIGPFGEQIGVGERRDDLRRRRHLGAT